MEIILESQISEIVMVTLDGSPGRKGELFLPFPVARQIEYNVWALPDLEPQSIAWAMIVLRNITATAKAIETRSDFGANFSH